MTPLVSALGGVATWLAAIFVIIHHTDQTRFQLSLLDIITVAAPIFWAAAASWFAYRHTARRRKLQALIVAVSSLSLTFAGYRIIDHFWHDQLFFTILKVPDYYP